MPVKRARGEAARGCQGSLRPSHVVPISAPPALYRNQFTLLPTSARLPSRPHSPRPRSAHRSSARDAPTNAAHQRQHNARRALPHQEVWRPQGEPGGRREARAGRAPDRSFGSAYVKRLRDAHLSIVSPPQSSTKRRLFAAEECEGCAAVPPPTSAPETFFGRQDSSTSALTCLDSAPSEEAAGPSTPEQGAAGRRSPAEAGFHALEAPLLYALQVGCPAGLRFLVAICVSAKPRRLLCTQ